MNKPNFTKIEKIFLFIGTVGLALFVSLDAIGAHAFKTALEDPALFRLFNPATQHLLLGSLALILMPVIGRLFNINSNWAMLLQVLGICLFSLNLLLLFTCKLTDFPNNWSSKLAPIGGFSFISSWLIFAVQIIRTKTTS